MYWPIYFSDSSHLCGDVRSRSADRHLRYDTLRIAREHRLKGLLHKQTINESRSNKITDSNASDCTVSKYQTFKV